MAVYNMTKEAIANYLSNTKIFIDIVGCSSSVGKRVNDDGYTYPISIKNIVTKTIVPQVDVFVDDDGFTVNVNLPEIKYYAKTNELSKSYAPGKSLSFEFKTNATRFGFRQDIGNVKKITYGTFDDVMNTMVSMIQEHISYGISDFIPSETRGWRFKISDVELDFDVVYNVK